MAVLLLVETSAAGGTFDVEVAFDVVVAFGVAAMDIVRVKAFLIHVHTVDSQAFALVASGASEASGDPQMAADVDIFVVVASSYTVALI